MHVQKKNVDKVWQKSVDEKLSQKICYIKNVMESQMTCISTETRSGSKFEGQN